MVDAGDQQRPLPADADALRITRECEHDDAQAVIDQRFRFACDAGVVLEEVANEHAYRRLRTRVLGGERASELPIPLPDPRPSQLIRAHRIRR